MTAIATTPRMAQPARFSTAADWLRALGDIPLDRVVMDPWPGTATEQDLLVFVERDKRLVELIDGTLVEKPVGWFEALIASRLGAALGSFVYTRKLGVIVGADGTLRMASGRVRLPDIAFISKANFPGGRLPSEPIPTLPPTLAVEVISEGNTKSEMRQKITEYFESGSQLVWLIYPKTCTVEIFESPSDDPSAVLKDSEILTGGSVLPGFSIPIADLFREEI